MLSIFEKAIAHWQNNEPTKALVLFEEGAALGDADCLYLAGFMLQDGLAGRFDRSRAFDYIERAAGLGHVDAIYALGYFYVNGGMSNLLYSDEILNQKRVPKDEAKGLALMRRAAEQGHKTAILNVARFYYDHRDKDPQYIPNALAWYAKGIQENEASCMVDMADILVLGEAVAENLDEAKKLYQRAKRSNSNTSARNAATQRLKDFKSLKTILKEAL